MPYYDFKCSTCGYERELWMSYEESIHPFCCDESMERVYGAVGIIFKGSGFYTNDKSKP